jgi:PAS domain S-box-containing protein
MTKKHAPEPGGSTELRQRAEARLADRGAPSAILSPSDAIRAEHELHVHQIELEMQNEDLLRAHAAAEAALERYTDLYDFAPVGYLTLGGDGVITQVNLTGARMLGIERSRLLGRRFATFVAEADRPDLHTMVGRVLESRTVQSGVVALASLDREGASRRYLQLTGSAEPGATECRVVALDITERKRVEEQVKIAQKLEAVGKLAGGVAHDFNNLLTVIVGNSEVMLDALPEGSPLRENLLEQRAAAQRGAALTRQLLAFGGKQASKASVVDVNELARGVSSLLRRLLGDDIELVLALAPDLGRIEVDPAQLDQVLMNLVIHASDAMPDGGTLTLSTANVDLDAAQADRLGLDMRPGRFVVVSVSDTGIGMDVATMQHIFEPFFMTKAAGQGTGLELSTVYGIVEQCGGGVAVRSELGAGTTFEIYFPRTEAPRPSAPPRTPKSEAGLRGSETILLVDDERPLRRVVERILGAAGYTILSAESGADALRIAATHSGPIHLTLSDVAMPGMTGVAFTRRLAQTHPATRVLFMSGHSGGAFDGSGERDRVSPPAFIGKPFTSAQLKRKVREVLDAPVR